MSTDPNETRPRALGPGRPEALRDGRYALLEGLGEGGMASVYRAFDTELKVERAVKVLQPGSVRGRTLRRRLRVEAQVMARLNHPNVLRVHDIGQEGDFDYIVMDLAPGGSLQGRLDAHGPLPLPAVVQIGITVLSALAVAHAQGIVHRDIKPGNILLDARGQPLLADFGIALLVDGERRTQQGVAMGSFAFMPPEQRIDAASVGPSADLYALGATLFALATAESPVDLFLVEEDNPRWTGVPAELRQVLQRACQVLPEARYASAGEMAAALGQLELAQAEVPPWFEVRPFPSPAAAFTARSGMGDPTPTPAAPARVAASTFPPPSPPASAVPWGTYLRITLVGLPLAVAAGLGASWWLRPPAEPAPERGRTVVAPVEAELGPPAAVAPAAVAPAPQPPPAPIEEPVPPAPPAEPPAPAASPAPAPPDPPAPAAPASPKGMPPTGTWRGTINGMPVELSLRGSAGALSGEVLVAWRGKKDRRPVRGSWDAGRRLLDLQEEDPAGGDAGAYALVLAEDGAGLTGSWRSPTGESVRVAFSR